LARYRLEPEAGEHTLAPDEAKARGGDYLQREILERGESTFRVGVTIAEGDDDPADATATSSSSIPAA
jgi:hypothetical protein